MELISRQAKGLRPSGLTNQPQGNGGTAENDIGEQAMKTQGYEAVQAQLSPRAQRLMRHIREGKDCFSDAGCSCFDDCDWCREFCR